MTAKNKVRQSAEPARLRFYPEIRTAHLERLRDMAPAHLVYLSERGDFDLELARASQESIQRVTFLRLLWLLVIQAWDEIEIPEPLWMRFAVINTTAVILIRLRDRLTSRKTMLFAYAIENGDLSARPLGAPIRSPRFWSAISGVMGMVPLRQLNRLAFGTQAAFDTYCSMYTRTFKQIGSARWRIIDALPVRCACTIEGAASGFVSEDAQRREHFLFVGALEDRKRVDVLLNVWQALRQRRPNAELKIIGYGERMAEVVARAQALEGVEVVENPPRALIHEAYLWACTVVAPAGPYHRWNEQVGLSIVEALAHGCTVVAHPRTGLSRELHQRGHYLAADGGDLVDAMNASATCCRARSDVWSQLPATDGRVAADQWLLSQRG